MNGSNLQLLVSAEQHEQDMMTRNRKFALSSFWYTVLLQHGLGKWLGQSWIGAGTCFMPAGAWSETRLRNKPSKSLELRQLDKELCVVVKYNTGTNLCGGLFSLLGPSKGEVVDARG
jgi:hypothetical protein